MKKQRCRDLFSFTAAVLADCVTWLESAGMWEGQVTWSPW